MREWIGSCHSCGEAIYCENGFFHGVLLPGHEYRCVDCDEKLDEESDQLNET